MEAHTAQFIRDMKTYAAFEASESERCLKEWRRLAKVAFFNAALFWIFAFFFPNLLPKIVLFAGGIGWVFAGRSTWRRGDLFAQKWLELREEALNHAEEARKRL